MKKYVSLFMVMCSTVAFSKEIKMTDVKFLQKKTIEMNYAIGSSQIKFMNDTHYRISYSSGGWNWVNEGTYDVKKGKIYLHPVKCEENNEGPKVKCQNSMGESVCTLIENENSFDYLKSLKVVSLKNRNIYSYDGSGGNTIVYAIKQFPVKEGAVRSVDGIKVIAMGCKACKTNDDAKIRKKPSIIAEAVKCSIEYEGDESSKKDFIPKGSEITVLARSMEKQKVNNRNDYWYYVNAGACERVWIHGAFVDLR